MIEGEIAIAEVAVGRQVEEQQPAETGGERETWIADARGDRLRPRRQPPVQPDGGDQREPRSAEKTEHERRRHAEQRVRWPCRFEHSIHPERPRHPGDPCGQCPDGKRQSNAGQSDIASPAQLEQAKTREHPSAPLPARGVQQIAHRCVLGGVHLCLARIGHQRRRARQHLGQAQPLATPLAGTRRSRQQRGGRQGVGRAMAVQRRAEQQQGVSGRTVSALSNGRTEARERGAYHREGASERQRPRRVGAQRIAFDVGLDVGVDRLDGVTQREQIAEPFALLQAKLGAPLLRVDQRALERSSRLSKGIDQGRRHGIDSRLAPSQFGSAAQAITHQRLGKQTVSRTQSGEDPLGQAPDHQGGIGKAPVASCVASRETLERGKERDDRGDGEQGFEERRPSRRGVGRRGGARAHRAGYGHRYPFAPAGEASQLLRRAEMACHCTDRAPATRQRESW